MTVAARAMLGVHCGVDQTAGTVGPTMSFQLVSQFYPYGLTHGGVHERGAIAQIFFSTDMSFLSLDDRQVISFLVDTYGQPLRRLPMFRIVGHADFRAGDSYNYQLALRRVRSVKDYLFKLLGKKGNTTFTAVLESQGERQPEHKGLAADRRVDVFSSFRFKPPPFVYPPLVITGRYSGPRSNKFRFRTLTGGGVGIGIVAQVFSMEVENVLTGEVAGYTYAGFGIGLKDSVQVNLVSPWSEVTLPDNLWLDVYDFQGPGRAHAIGLGYTGSVWVFDGPMERGIAHGPVVLTFTGWDLYLGLNRDIRGNWTLRG